MYVIKPTLPFPGILTPSYNICAIDIVFFKVNPNFLDASCCIVLVVKGGAGFFFLSDFFILLTINSLFFKSSSILFTCSSFLNSSFLLSIPTKWASNLFFLFEAFLFNIAYIFQYSSGLNFSISSSLSQINLTATDWTLPADNPFLTFFHNTGLILYPTILSSIRLACCASIKFLSIFLGCLTAFFTASFVISLNVILHSSSSGIPNIYDRCQAIASPSRSGSVAKYTLFAFLASFFNSFIKLAFPLIFIYWGSKLFSISIPIFDLGKSLMCPIEAITLTLPPKNLFIVFALAGDSTIINLSTILPSNLTVFLIHISYYKLILYKNQYNIYYLQKTYSKFVLRNKKVS